MKLLPVTALVLMAGCATVRVETGEGTFSERPGTNEVSLVARAETNTATRVRRVVRVGTDGGTLGKRAEISGEVLRPRLPEGLSGITWLAGSSYLAIDDSGGVMYPLSVLLDPVRERPMSVTLGTKVVLEGVTDGEGIAFDPLRGSVWVSDETGPRITEHDLRSGRRLGELKLPPQLSRSRANLSLESLTIAPDGLTLWTANEEPLADDGTGSDSTTGTVVRLFRFVREDADGPWKPAGQFAYQEDSLGGRRIDDGSRSGISDLCFLPDGRLLVLERELSAKKFRIPSFRMRIYEVDVMSATDVTSRDRLDGIGIVRAAKKLLLESNTGLNMYEGLCLGPWLSNESRVLMLVSDGDGPAGESILSIRLF